MEKNNGGIIPVTCAIREYLKYQDDIEKEIRKYYELLHLSGADFHIFEKNHNIVIEHINNDSDRLRQVEYLNRLQFLKNIANKINKSLIWVYQELVLSGFGLDVSEDSDIYQVSLLAYQDVSSFLYQGDDGEKEFEDNYLLSGNRYEVSYAKKRKKLDKEK